jgi:hypothetical protein
MLKAISGPAPARGKGGAFHCKNFKLKIYLEGSIR